LTTKRFTGQYHESTLPGGEGLYFYNARWYDAKLGRFVSADTLVPDAGNPQSFNRYSYVYNNPLKFVDPGGHDPICVCIVPLIKKALEEMGFLTPMAPFYLVPAAIGTYQKIGEQITGQEPEPSLEMTADWYWELGEESRVLGPDSKITQALMRDEGVSQARQAYMQGGNQDISGDAPYRYVFGLRDAAREFTDVFKRWDWSTSFLGGYDVEIKTVGYEGQHRVAEFSVTNETGWQSATRVWGFSFKQNERRIDPGPGGTLYQTYRWRETIPRQPYSLYNRSIPQ